MQNFIMGVTIYLMTAVLTFGHAAGTTTCTNYQGLVIMDCPAERAMKGTFGGMFWPLYWSWVIFEVKE